MATSTDWQCDKTLQDCLKHMFDTKTAADVTFLVGENKEIVRAHKFILISRSPVFYAMFEGPMSEKGEVTIPDIGKDVFVDFLRYLYTDDTTLKSGFVVQIMYAAKKYCVDRLTERCHAYIKESLTAENACDILEQAHFYVEESLAADCRKIIFENPEKCLNSPGFANLCQPCVISITEPDDLATTEDVVFKAVMRWSEAECERQNLEVTDVKRRQVLGDVIFTVRFPIIEDNIFNKEVVKHDVLTPEEFLSIVRVKQSHLNCESIRFKSNARVSKRQPKITVARFVVSKTEFWSHSGSTDAISFKVSQNVMFHGVGIYGMTAESSIREIKIVLELYDQQEALLTKYEHRTHNDGDRDIVDVLLRESLRLTANGLYTVAVTVSSEQGSFSVKRGTDGQRSVNLNLVNVSFFPSNKSNNNTQVNFGQIPHLYISLC